MKKILIPLTGLAVSATLAHAQTTLSGDHIITGNLDVGVTGTAKNLKVTGTTLMGGGSAAGESLSIGGRISILNGNRYWTLGAGRAAGSAGVNFPDNSSIAPGTFAIRDQWNQADRLRIDVNGNIGIGTTSPTGKMTIIGSNFSTTSGTQTGVVIGGFTGSVGPAIEWLKPGSSTVKKAAIAPVLTGGDDDMIGLGFYVGSDTGFVADPVINAMQIVHGGNVGIGTTTPTKKLDVNGHAKFRGAVTMSGTTVNGTVVASGTNLLLIPQQGDLSMGEFTGGIQP